MDIKISTRASILYGTKRSEVSEHLSKLFHLNILVKTGIAEQLGMGRTTLDRKLSLHTWTIEEIQTLITMGFLDIKTNHQTPEND